MSGIEYFYGLTLFGFIASCLFFAAVRWFHLCRPFHKDVKYYYPARTTATICYLSFIVLLPFVAHPLEPRAWLFTKTFVLVMTPFYGAQMLFSYFGTVKSWFAWRKPGWVIQSVLSLATAALWIWAVWPGITPDAYSINKLVLLMIACGIVSFIYVIWMLHWIYRQLKNVEKENFSNPSDFPSRLARQALVLIVLSLILFLTPVVADSPLLMGITFLLSMGINTYLLILILHPHRHRPIIDELIQEEESMDSFECISDTKQQKEEASSQEASPLGGEDYGDASAARDGLEGGTPSLMKPLFLLKRRLQNSSRTSANTLTSISPSKRWLIIAVMDARMFLMCSKTRWVDSSTMSINFAFSMPTAIAKSTKWLVRRK